ncbi:transglutaminase-like cysteine peptidase [Nitratireductor sp.]|uniref:transglutaminase-like cysteine peptidase n=1 Tax=Nitratireductor sp. TaxID=1872084 RepID=UPI003F909ADC
MSIAKHRHTLWGAAFVMSALTLAATPQPAAAGHVATALTSYFTTTSLSLPSASTAIAAVGNSLVRLKHSWTAAIAGLPAKRIHAAASTRTEIRRNKLKNPASATGVFGSVAIPFRALPSSASWRTVYPSIERAEFTRCADDSGCTPRATEMSHLVREIKAKPFSQKLEAINRTVNRTVAYMSDRANYRRLDVWATPTQIIDRGKGDCEDYAILKMAALNAAGIPLSSMSIVVLQDQNRSLFHAVLAVSTTKGHYILDNLHDRVMKDTALPNYLPLYSLSGHRSWIHGKRRDGSMVAAITPLPRDLAPGEGFQAASGHRIENRRIGAN